MKNNWYFAKLIFAIQHPQQQLPTQFDEQLRLIAANDKLEAIIKARMLGIKEERTYTNEQELEVTWTFVDVIELTLVEAFTDGMEICSRIDEHEATDSYAAYVKHRGQLLVQQAEQSVAQSAVNV
ncbi:MAG: DUF4288 domain-containing protein [Bacteroidia bacterium]|jgi:hypothetical protein|nr:DUF4288 domain-containing protein [Bacteroidia bacterium]